MTPAPSLEDLIRTATEDAPSSDPLARLSAAATLSTALAESADALLGHFVDQCRRAGHSWAEIGSALGVTKQAAQKRWVAPPSQDHFTPKAQRVLEAALAVPAELDHGFVGTEHLLIALFAEPEAIGARVLREAGTSRDEIVARVLQLVPRRTAGRGGFTPKAARLVQQDLTAEALELGHDYVGTEHILLALLRRPETVAARVLAEFGLERDSVTPTILAKIDEVVAARADEER